MAYVPLNLSIVNWASPINIVGTDKVINLDEAVNQIITSDAQSLVNHINTEMAKITPYLSTELSKIYAEVDDRVVAAEAAKVAAQAAQAAAETAQAAAETAQTAAEAAQAAAAASAAAASASQSAAAASAAAASGSETNAAASAAASAASAAAALASQNAAAASAAAAATSENNSQLREWEAEAWKLTAQSYAVEAEDVPVNLVTSDGDGTFTYTPQTGVYSALHHRTKGLAQDASTKLPKDGSEPMTGNLEAPSMSIGGDFLSPFVFKNKLINGGFDIWQRGTSQTTSGYGSDDRWANGNLGSTKTHSRQTATDIERVLFNSNYFSRTVVSSVVGTTNYVLKEQRIENVTALAGKTVTISFWAKADAPKNIAICLEQYFGTGGTPSSPVQGIGAQLVALTNTWAKYEVTITLPTIVGKTLGTDGVNTTYTRLMIWFDAGDTHDARTASLGHQSGTFDIAEMQLEVGTVATPFEDRPLGLELSLCQRYYEKSYQASQYIGDVANAGCEYTILAKNVIQNGALGTTRFLVTKRATPTVKVRSTLGGTVNTFYNITKANSYGAIVNFPCDVGFHLFSNTATTMADQDQLRWQWDADAEL